MRFCKNNQKRITNWTRSRNLEFVGRLFKNPFLLDQYDKGNLTDEKGKKAKFVCDTLF